MKPDIQQQQQANLLARYLSGEMTNEERSDFESRYLSSPEEVMQVNALRKDWEAAGERMSPRLPDTGKAWNSMYARLRADDLLTARGVRPAHIRFGYLSAAAGVIILLSVAVFLYLNQHRTGPPVQMVSVTTGADSLTLVKTLDDGSVIYLSDRTALSFPKVFASASRNVQLEGEAFFDIERDPLKPFIIETQDATIEVLGTAFNVINRNTNDFELNVERGRVRVTSRNDPDHPVEAGKGEKVCFVGKSLQKSKAGTLFPWYRQRMHFKDETLDHILEVMNRNFGVTFVLRSDQAGSRRLTLTCDEGVAKMTELICLVLNLKSQVQNDSIVLMENNQPGK